MAFAGLSTVIVYKKEKCLVKSGKDSFWCINGLGSEYPPQGLKPLRGYGPSVGQGEQAGHSAQ